jgi:soluble lytic murein transglycosylase-like protein
VPPLAERSVQAAESLAAAFDRIAPGFERLAAVAETTPAFVASERKATIDSLGGELTRMIAFLQQERLAALKQVTQERIAALETISKAASDERNAFERDIERVGVEVVDHAIWRLAQLLAAALVCLGLGTVGILLLVRKLFFKPASRA